MPHTIEAAALALAAMLSAAGNMALVGAWRLDRPSRLAPWSYSFLVWTTLVGMAFWGDRPLALDLLGMAMIAAGGWIGAGRTPDRTRRGG